MSENEIAKIVVDICYKIHSTYGPGMFESVYESVFCHEWNKTGIVLARQSGIRLIHDGLDMGLAFVPDLVPGNKVIVELKSVERLTEVHFKQVLTYLKITGFKLGLLINFNVPYIKDGIHRIVNKL
jgi:GxxExxY protein